MPPLNYERLRELVELVEADESGIEKLQDTEADEWLTELSQVDADAETDIEKMQLLFKAARAIMEFESAQAAAATDEAEEQAKAGAAREDRLEEEREHLKEELSSLRMELASSGAGGGGHEAKSLHAEIDSLRDENADLKTQNRERDRELADEREKSDRLYTQISNLEKDVKTEKDRRFELENQMRELKRRVDAQQETQTGRRGEHEQLQKKLRERTEELMRLADEVNNLTEANESFRGQVDRLKGNLEDATKEMDKTTDRYVQVKDALRAADDTIEVLEKENAELKRQIDAPKEEQSSAYDELIKAVDRKIEDWKGLLIGKDKELQSYKQKVESLKLRISEYSIDTDRASVAALSKAVEDRDHQIRTLKSQLETATTDMNQTVELVEDLQNQLQNESGASAMQKRLSGLARRLSEREKRAAEAVARADDADAAAADTHRQLADLAARLRRYETGEYGLSEAIDELQQAKTQLGFRDKQLAEVTQKCSRLEVEMHDVMWENDDLRTQTGKQPRKVDAKAAALERDSQRESDRALNIILQREIDRLEDERLELKLQLRKLSQKMGTRAVALGLTADDLLAIEEFTEELKNHRAGAMERLNRARTQQRFSDGTVPDIISHQLQGQAEQLSSENAAQRTKIASLATENAHLLAGLKELQAQLKDGNMTGGGSGMECAALDKLLARADARGLGGSADLVSELKSKHDQLVGKNDELRSELRETRVTLQAAKSELDAATEKAAVLEQRLSEDGQSEYRTFDLPEGMTPNSSMQIMSLNEQLLQVLEEASLKSDQLAKLNEIGQTFQSKLAVLKHKQGLVYQELHEAKKAWSDEKSQLLEKYRSMEDTYQASQIRLQEFDRLMDTLNKDESEMHRRLSEMTRKFTVMRINETIMIRKYRSLEMSEQRFQQQNSKLQHETMQMEATVKERLASLQRQKEIASYEIASLHKALESSVPLSDFDKLKKETEELSEKHRKLMGKDIKSMEGTTADAKVQLALNKLQRENKHLQELLQIEKEKLVRSASHMDTESVSKSAVSENSDGDYLAKRVSLLEMKELNERQRAEHSQQMYESQRQQLQLIEDRNIELEAKIAELGQANLALQKSEQQWRDELNSSVTKDVYETVLQRITELERSEMSARVELDSHKAVSDVAQSQADYWARMDKLRNVELEECRATIRDLQAETQHRAIIGRLHAELVHVKLADTDTQEQLRLARRQLRSSETRALRSEQRADTKERALRRLRADLAHQMAGLRQTVAGLRTRFAGCVTLAEQEKLHSALGRVQADGRRVTAELVEAVEAAEAATLLTDELRLKQAGLEELVATLRRGESASQVIEWQKKMEQLRLAELRLTRKLQKAQLTEKQQCEEISLLTAAITKLEEGLVQTSKTAEERQIGWEQRESELEERIRNFETAERFEDGEMALAELPPDEEPDLDAPLALQLERALNSLRKHLRSIAAYRKEVETLNKANEALMVEKRELRSQAAASERLAMHLKATAPLADRDTTEIDIALREKQQLEHALSNARTAVELLQTQLGHKDETIEGYKRIVFAVQADVGEAERRHHEQLRRLRDRAADEADERLRRFRDDAERLGSARSSVDEQHAQFVRIAELEDTVMEQENAITALVEKLKQARSTLPPVVSGQPETHWPARTATARNSAAPVIHEQAATHDERKSETARSGSSRGSAKSTSRLNESDPFEAAFTENVAEDDAPSSHSDKKFSSSSSASSSSSSRSASLQRSAKSNDPQLPLSTKTIPSSVSKESSKSREASEPRRPPPPPADDSHAVLQWKVKCDRIKDRLVTTQRENQALTRALGELKAEMLSSAVNPRQSRGAINATTAEEERKREEMEDELRGKTRDLKRARESEAHLKREIGDLKQENVRKDGTIQALKQEKLTAEREIEQLERRITHLRESVKLKLQETENRELKKKLTILEGQVGQMRGEPAEKPLETTTKSANGVARWEESKRLQRHVEKLKEQLTLKTTESEEAQKLIARLRERVNRLEDQLRVTGNKQTSSKSVAELAKLQNEVKELRSKMLTMQAEASSDSEVIRLQKLNSQLEERCASLERESTEASQQQPIIAPVDVPVAPPPAVVVLSSVLSDTQAENRRLIGQLETFETELDETRSSLLDCQRQLEAVQLQLAEAQADRQRVGRTGAIETVNRLHAAVERLEAEKDDLSRQVEELKLSSARLSNADADLQRIRSENRQLKDKLAKQAPRVAWAEQLQAERATQQSPAAVAPTQTAPVVVVGATRPPPTAAAAESVQRLTRQLKREKYENESLREELSELKATCEQQQADISRMQQLRTQKRQWHSNGSPSDDKLRSKDALVQFKETRIQQLEELIRLEIERNQSLIYENRRMKNKLQAQEWAPTRDIVSNDDWIRQIRNLKSEISHLEGAANELKDELEVLNRHIKPAVQGTQMDLFGIKERLKNYDRVLKENIELKLERSALMARA